MDIAVLASGSGTNLQALIETPAIRPHIRLVASDRPNAPALERARRAGIEVLAADYSGFPDREAFCESLAADLEGRGVKAVVLAGFMRILTRSFVDRFPNRILNLHPSLLPAFPGARAVEDALAHGVKVSGVTVHFVDHLVDNGPIVAQRAIAVEDADTPESLHARTREVEHELYPSVVAALLEGRIEVEGRLVRWT